MTLIDKCFHVLTCFMRLLSEFIIFHKFPFGKMNNKDVNKLFILHSRFILFFLVVVAFAQQNSNSYKLKLGHRYFPWQKISFILFFII